MKLHVSIKRQQMDLMDGCGKIERTYPVSTSRFGLGSLPDSNCTPLGRFRIVQKIGHGVPLFTIFQSRTVVGIWDDSARVEDLVLTRILWLDGLEETNVNTFSRHIYIHGTNQETQLGRPASHGCIRLGNVDVVDLFEHVDLATEVSIGDVPVQEPAMQEEFPVID